MNAVFCMPQKPKEIGQNLGSMVGSFAAYIAAGIPASESRPARKLDALLAELDKASKAVSSCAVIGKEMANQVRGMPVVVGEFIDADMVIPALLEELRVKVRRMREETASGRSTVQGLRFNFIQRVKIKHAFDRVANSYLELIGSLTDLEACIEKHDEAAIPPDTRALSTPLEFATHAHGVEGAETLAEFEAIGTSSAFSIERLRRQLDKDDQRAELR